MTTRSNLNNSPHPAVVNPDPEQHVPTPHLDEALLNRMANAFFAAWPQTRAEHSELGAFKTDMPAVQSTEITALQQQPDDLPLRPDAQSDTGLGPAPHSVQPAEALAAFNHRLPNIAYQKSLNPDLPEHIPNYPDHPERRGLASLPVIGGAALPKAPFEPQFPQVRDQIVDHAVPERQQLTLPTTATASTAPIAAEAPETWATPAMPPPIPTASPPSTPPTQLSGFYFIDEFTSAAPHSDHSAQDTVTNRLNEQDAAFPDLDRPMDTPIQIQSAPEKHIPDPETNAHRPEPSSNTTTAPYYFLQAPDLDQPAQSKPHSYPEPQLAQEHQALNQVLDVQRIRQDFPILSQRIHGHPLIWLDNAATTQKPQQVIDRISHFYQYENSNIHRAAHELAARATDAYEHAREVVARFIGAESPHEIIFVRGATEGINLIAKTWGVQNIHAGDEILVSHLEHHANIVPWYQLCQLTGAKLKVIPVDESGQLILEHVPSLLTPRTKLVSLTQVSNALGTITPVAEVIEMAHAKNIRVLVDGAQSVSHMPTQVRALDADFFVFSGHKVFAPTGIGVVYAKAELLESMPEWQGGGNMIEDVRFEHVIYQPAPQKFEAGTGNIADAVGLGAALEYVENIGIHQIARYEHDLLQYAQNGLLSVPGLRLIGTALNKASVMSFVLQGYRPEQVGQALNRQGIAVRAGHHCAQPILRRFGVEKTVRPSLAFYNTYEEVDILVSALHQLTRKQQVF